MPRALLIALSLPLGLACAQQFSVGALAGGSRHAADNYSARFSGFFGAEAGVAGAKTGHGVFFDYARWPVNESFLRSVDVVAFGWRAQFTRKRVKPFTDFGLCIVTTRYGPRGSEDPDRAAGLVMGGGIMVPLSDHFYLRPSVRLHATAFQHSLGFGAAIGYRF